VTRDNVIQACYLVAAVCFILALKGLSSPRTARAGNLLGAAGMLLAIGVTFAQRGIGQVKRYGGDHGASQSDSQVWGTRV